jgi:hypothetical protein
LDRDVNYYNRHHNPGDPIEICFNFTPDLAEGQQSGEYNDSPPDEDN